MADTVTLSEKQLAIRLRADAKGAPKAVFRAMVSAAQRGKAFIVGKTPVDRGILRNAWKVLRMPMQGKVELTNDQPYAGIVERGSRGPFRVSEEGIWALKGWVMRKFKAGEMFPEGAHTKIGWAKGWAKATRTAKGQSMITSKRKKAPKGMDLENEAEKVARAIAAKFARVGMQGKRFIWHNLNALAGLMDAEVKRSLSVFFNRPMSGGGQ